MADSSSGTLTIATYNIHVGVPMGEDIGAYPVSTSDMDALADVIARAQADIVALQEVDCEYGLPYPDRRRSSLINQARYLAASGKYHYAFGSAQDDSGYPTDNPGYVEWGTADLWTNNGMVHGEVGNGLLSRWDFTSPPENIPLPKDAGQERRACIRAEFPLPDSPGRLLVVYATHLQHNSGETRYKQMEAILERASKESEDHLVMILGDLNHELDDTETSNPVNLAIKSGFHDLGAPPPGKPLSDYHTFPADAPDRRIDFIFASKPVNTLETRVIQSPASDHLLVLATIDLNSVK